MPPRLQNFRQRPRSHPPLDEDATLGVLEGRRGTPTNSNSEVNGRVGRSAATVGAGTIGMGNPVSTEGGGAPGPWSTWPMLMANTVHSFVYGWFKRMDAALLSLPGNVGPVISTMVSEMRVKEAFLGEVCFYVF